MGVSMVAVMPKTRIALLLLGCWAMGVSGPAQTIPATPPPVANQPADALNRPLPDIVALMRDVETNERKAETVEKDYIYHSVETEVEKAGNGQVKKTTVSEFDHYWIDGVPVQRLMRKNGKDLSADELAREDERIDKEVAKARERREQGDAKGKETDARGEEEITLSRLLELGAFTNPRRVQLNGRDTIAVDYAGDPKAKTRNRAEEIIRDIVGTAWIDEQDHVLARVEGHFANAFKIGAGLVVNVQKDTRFEMQQTKINGEVWLPANFAGEGAARALLFFNFNGSLRAVQSDYRKFRTTSTVLPGATAVNPPPTPENFVQR